MSYIRVLPGKTYAELVLTQGKVSKISIADIARVERFSWQAVNAEPDKSKEPRWYARGFIQGKNVYLHRFVLGHKKLDNLQVDHINNDTLDNRRENLRVTTNKQNAENRAGAYSSSKTGVRGVSMQTYKHSDPTYIAKVMHEYVGYGKQFPFTDEGFKQAEAWVTECRRQLFTHDKEPPKGTPQSLVNEVAEYIKTKQAGSARADSKTGIPGLGIAVTKTKTKTGINEHRYWRANKTVDGKRLVKQFPFTEDGKIQAMTWLEQQGA